MTIEELRGAQNRSRETCEGLHSIATSLKIEYFIGNEDQVHEKLRARYLQPVILVSKS